MDSFSALFQESKGAPIEYRGGLVFPKYERQLSAHENRMQITRISHNTSAVQGLRIRSINGRLEVNEQKLKDTVLWADSSPSKIEVNILEKPTIVKVWNVWKLHDLMQAWIGNAGLRIAEQGGSVLLSCSDGIGEPDFTGLIAQIDFKS